MPAHNVTSAVRAVRVFGEFGNDAVSTLAARLLTVTVRYSHTDDDRNELFYVENADGQFYSKRGAWHRFGTTERFIRNHYFSHDEALVLAFEAVAAMNGSDRIMAINAKTIEFALTATIEGIPGHHSVLVMDEGDLGFSVNHKGRLLSKAGVWHFFGQTERFNRNHYFSYQEAVERAYVALEALVTMTLDATERLRASVTVVDNQDDFA